MYFVVMIFILLATSIQIYVIFNISRSFVTAWSVFCKSLAEGGGRVRTLRKLSIFPTCEQLFLQICKKALESKLLEVRTPPCPISCSKGTKAILVRSWNGPSYLYTYRYSV